MKPFGNINNPAPLETFWTPVLGTGVELAAVVMLGIAELDVVEPALARAALTS
jgi:hypothetical protein